MSIAEKNAKPIVLVHGWGGSFDAVWGRNGWTERLREAGYRPIAVDLPGHGTSSRSHEPADYWDLAGDVLARLPDGPISAIGYSLGAKVLLEIAIRDPERFEKLILGGLGGNAFAPERLGDALAETLEQGITPQTPPPLRVLAEYGVRCGNDPLAIAACLRRPPNPALTPERVSRIPCPVVLVVGDKDVVALPVEPLSHAMPDASIVLLEGVDHLSLPESHAFAFAAMRFLSGSLVTETK